jgi:hypothetical protein
MNFKAKQFARHTGRIGLGLLVITTSLAGCGSSTLGTKREKEVITSQQQWEKEKPRHENSYAYTVMVSSFAGFGSTTVVTVTNGTVTGRSFESFTTDGGTGAKTVTRSWSETAGDLMSHQEGAEAVTLDVIYDTCRQEWLTANTKTHQTYFENKHNGIISLCGYLRKGCQDDCFEGVNISTFEWLR